jgi:hypothetical protein
MKSFSLEAMPVKSSLSKYRNKISSLFFKSILMELLSSFKRPTWRGYHVYGTDGFELTLPGGGDLRAIGYKGKRLKTESGAKGETYYPHMYTVQTYDVLSRTTRAVYVSTVNHETNGALSNIENLEPKSITLYDRGFCNNKVMAAHFEKRSHFFIRFKTGKSIPREIQDFWNSNKRQESFLFQNDPEMRIYLFKIKHGKKKETHVYATSVKGVSLREAEELYRLRWDVENYFRDQVNNLPLEQWHSKNENGVLQELYVRLWIMNYARIEQFLSEKPIKNPLSRIYKRSNFKLILDFIISHWSDFFARKRKFLQKIKLLVKASTEKRKRNSRSVKRQLKYQNKNYPAANIIFDSEEKVA